MVGRGLYVDSLFYRNKDHRGSCSAQCKTIFWVDLIICEFLIICSTSLKVEGQQQRSDSNSNTGDLFSQRFYNITHVI